MISISIPCFNKFSKSKGSDAGRKKNKRKKGVPLRVNIEAIAPLWTESKPEPATGPADRPTWEHVMINNFYDMHILPHAGDLAEPAKEAIHKILNLLDKHGDIPSETLDGNIIYEEISLLDHVLCVTRCILDRVKHDPNRREVIGRYLIIGLGFSFGIATDFKNSHDMAFKSLMVLSPLIADLHDKDTICQAIKEGLSENNPKTLEGRVLQTAICAARKEERETAIALAQVWGTRISENNIIEAIKREFPDA
jgi:hypothetical protein